MQHLGDDVCGEGGGGYSQIQGQSQFGVGVHGEGYSQALGGGFSQVGAFGGNGLPGDESQGALLDGEEEGVAEEENHSTSRASFGKGEKRELRGAGRQSLASRAKRHLHGGGAEEPSSSEDRGSSIYDDSVPATQPSFDPESVSSAGTANATTQRRTSDVPVLRRSPRKHVASSLPEKVKAVAVAADEAKTAGLSPTLRRSPRKHASSSVGDCSSAAPRSGGARKSPRRSKVSGKGKGKAKGRASSSSDGRANARTIPVQKLRPHTRLLNKVVRGTVLQSYGASICRRVRRRQRDGKGKGMGKRRSLRLSAGAASTVMGPPRLESTHSRVFSLLLRCEER